MTLNSEIIYRFNVYNSSEGLYDLMFKLLHKFNEIFNSQLQLGL